MAAPEGAALQVHSAVLPALHTIQMEKAALKSKQESMELQALLAKADAKQKALSDSGEQEDPMNEYLEENKQQPAEPSLTETSAIEFAPLATVPKTSLQNAPELSPAHSLKPAMTSLQILKCCTDKRSSWN